MNQLKMLKKIIKIGGFVEYRVERTDGWGCERSVLIKSTDLKQVRDYFANTPANTLMDGPHHSFYYYYKAPNGRRGGGALTIEEASNLIEWESNR